MLNRAPISSARVHKPVGLPVTLTISPALFCAILVFYVLFPTGHPLRLAIYTTPFLVSLELLILQNFNVSKRWIYVAMVLLAYCALMALRSPNLILASKEVTFILLPILLLSFDFRVHRSFLLAFLLSVTTSSIFLSMSSDADLFAISLQYSNAAAETSVGLAIPLVAFTYFHNKQIFGGGVSLVAMLLVYKRIAIGAFSLLSLLFIFTNSLKLVWVRTIGGLLMLSILLFAGLNMSAIYGVVSQSFLASGIDLSPNALSSGRYAMELSFRAAVLEKFSMWQVLFGAGPGASGYFFALYSEYASEPFPHLHNDWLRIYAEYGVFGLAMVMLVMGALVRKGNFVWFAALYTGFCFLTDNVLTYSFYWFILIFCARLQSNARNKAHTQ